MARARNIKPGFFTNELLAECSVHARLLFAALWLLADREGRLEDRPKKIKAESLPYDNVDVDKLLAELEQREFITRYRVDGKQCIQVNKFKEHQRPHHNENASRLPPVPVQTTRTTKVVKQDNQGIPDQLCNDSSGALIPSSLIPDTGYLNDDSGFQEGAEKPAPLNGYSREAAELADVWCFHLKRKRHNRPADFPQDVAHEIDELLRFVPRESIAAEIVRTDRNRSEWFSQMAKRLNDARAGPSMKFTGLESFGKKAKAAGYDTS